MDFPLSPEIIESVIFCIENQKETFLFDTVRKRCVPAEEAGAEDSEGGLIALPEWTSVHGFRLMEEFAGTVKNPALREKLRETLATRAGVFKRFREVLGAYPEFEEAWRAFKKDRLKRTVLRWYKTAALADRLSDLGEEPEETYEIVRNDFIFGRVPFTARLSDLLRDSADTMRRGAGKTGGAEKAGDGRAAAEQILAGGFAEILSRIPAPARTALSALLRRFWSGTPCNPELFYAETPSGEKAGAALTETFPADGGSVLAITAAAVKPEFRGMGVFSQLLETVKSAAGEAGGRAFCILPVTPAFIRPLLERMEMHADIPDAQTFFRL